MAEQEYLPAEKVALETLDSKDVSPTKKKPKKKNPMQGRKNPNAGRKKIHLDLDKIEALAALGLTELQIAHNLGVNWQTLNERKKEYPEYSDAIKKGQAKGIRQVSNALFNNAIGGNTVAQIFYLKNRDPTEWADKKDINLAGTIGIVVGRDEQEL